MPQVDEIERYEEELDNPAMEVPSKYLMWRSHPSAIKRGFEHITKDLVLSNLSESDLMLLRLHFDLFMQNEALVKDNIIKGSDVNVANEFLESNVNVICASSVGFKGFGRSLDTTMIQLKEIKREELKKGGFSFRRGKRND